MNIFRKHVKNYDENEIKGEGSTELHADTIPEESLSAKNVIQENNTNYPNPELLRRLLEGTSFDRRTGFKLKQEGKKEANPQKETPNTQSKKIPEKFPNYREDKQGIPILNKDLSSKRKKFINKERESRLGHIVYEVLGNKTIKN
jgi:hypothetical protein